jgi:Icc-related predicted phosphoesterase
MEETNIFLKEYFQKLNNISFLDNNYENYDEYFFIGTTLWSNITNPIYEINDVYSIPNFNYIKYNKLNIESIKFLNDALNNNNCIVITHHLPSESLINKKYKTTNMIPYNQWFYCDLDRLIDEKKCWIYGHTHTPSNVLINEIPFLCNPIGYPNENINLNFETNIKL